MLDAPPVQKLPPDFANSQYLSNSQACELLKISRRHLYVLTFRKPDPIPSVKLGPKARRFGPMDKLRWWLENQDPS